MPFRARNAYYLRISAHDVLPLYLYLDERHLDWMSDRVLQHVLADLQHKILPKMRAEARFLFSNTTAGTGNKSSVDVHRGDTYQFAFFFNKTEPHAVLVKTRTFTDAPALPAAAAAAAPAPRPRQKKRKGKSAMTPVASDVRKKRKTKTKTRAKTAKGKERARDDESSAVSSSGDDGKDYDMLDAVESDRAGAAPLRRSARTRKAAPGGDEDDGHESPSDSDAADLAHPSPDKTDAPAAEPLSIDSDDHDDNAEAPVTVKAEAREADLPHSRQYVDLAADIDEEEDTKLKLQLQLRYEGFQIHGHCLCVVVEPWPPLQRDTASGTASAAPADNDGSIRNRRAETPLFLPNPDRARSTTPAAGIRSESEHQLRPLRPFPMSDQLEVLRDESDDEEGLMSFTQALKVGGDFQPGDAEDDDEMDGAALFGDADETREF